MQTFHGFDINQWGEGSEDFALTDNDEDFALFENEGRGIYSSHIFMRNRRGFDFGKRVLNVIFTEYSANVLKGLTPIQNKAALCYARKIGFKSYGTLDTVAGTMQLFILTKEEWRRLNE